MNFPVRFLSIASLSLLGATLHADEPYLPLPVAGPELPAFSPAAPGETRFMKPTKSIKPPQVSRLPQGLATVQPQINTPTVARLRRLILMPGGQTPEVMREQILASGHSRTPVTVVGMNAPAPILTNLASFFGSDVNADSQKKLLDTVRQGMGSGSNGSGTTAPKAPRRVEIVGWLPSEGVMAVAVYPES